ncbi:hypothetical protein [Pseudoalteromonas lipolytica]|uniref:Uncharacterized protein n=1 Tax=Pseudoalteromonas lipolytica TaxID=570156 RepID=A0ABU8SVL4_9GAMM
MTTLLDKVFLKEIDLDSNVQEYKLNLCKKIDFLKGENSVPEAKKRLKTLQVWQN